ncbi:Peroxisomal membrane protein PAS20 [Dimargaris verticillata]|uniref:Peroxisomal membrane protein PEX13 n=1 Tax=Dimargaris verticillata TaxID=2761393 RepID=A0A9W8B8R7_9FUNG|nr:Peroxisomal membrane protein PAS20 [Dimargaris verticillata]
MTSPPKPWETQAAATTAPTPASGAPLPATSHNASNAPPSVPPRPASYPQTSGLGATTTAGYGYSNAGYGGSYSGYSRPGMYNRYGSGGYGGTYGSYSPYGSSGYGGYGGYGPRLGGLYGRPMMGSGFPGDDPESLSAGLEASTRSTFQVLEQIVNAFGGFAQMLDSTFQATHSSFMAMVGMAEQLGVLRTYLGQVFSVVALYRTLRNMGYRLTGHRPPVAQGELTAGDFEAYRKRSRFSIKPLLVFLLVVVGFPYLMVKLIRKMAQNHQRRLEEAAAANPAAANPTDATAPNDMLAKIDFAQARYDFQGEPPVELTLHRGDIIAVLSKVDSQGQPSPWWRGRLRSGQTGYFPANYVELIEKQPIQPPPPPGPAQPPSDLLAPVFSQGMDVEPVPPLPAPGMV